jgi:hypothetical protein
MEQWQKKTLMHAFLDSFCFEWVGWILRQVNQILQGLGDRHCTNNAILGFNLNLCLVLSILQGHHH